MVEKNAPAVRLGRGFWIVTAVLAILAIASIVFWYVAPIYRWMHLPVAIATAKQVDQLSRFMLATGSALYIFVVGYIVYFAIAFRVRKSDPPDAIGIQIHDNHKLEFWWTVIPAAFVVLLSVLSIKIWYEITLAPSNGLVVEAIGHKWYYTFRYPQVNGEITNAMHLPIGVPVTLNLTSADVIHSFWVPAMRLKNDMVPGLVTQIHFTPTRIGTYQIICTQFCGIDHSLMHQQRFVIDSQANYQKWYHAWQVKNAKVSNALPSTSGASVNLAAGDVAAGKALFAQKCTACHAMAPFTTVKYGPGLLDVLHDPTHPNLVNGQPANPADAAAILEKGYTGTMGSMPNAVTNGLSSQDIANLVAYLNSMK